jgi:hypothetical protein
MENVLNSDFQITSSSDLFDDVSVIVTGLLDVVQRCTVLLKEGESDQDRIALQEALRKALIVAELLIREPLTRDKINDSRDIINRIIFILLNLENIDDKVMTLEILFHLLHHDRWRHDFSRQDGFKCLKSLYLNETILGVDQLSPFSSPELNPSVRCPMNSQVLHIYLYL